MSVGYPLQLLLGIPISISCTNTYGVILAPNPEVHPTHVCIHWVGKRFSVIELARCLQLPCPCCFHPTLLVGESLARLGTQLPWAYQSLPWVLIWRKTQVSATGMIHKPWPLFSALHSQPGTYGLISLRNIILFKIQKPLASSSFYFQLCHKPPSWISAGNGEKKI